MKNQRARELKRNRDIMKLKEEARKEKDFHEKERQERQSLLRKNFSAQQLLKTPTIKQF